MGDSGEWGWQKDLRVSKKHKLRHQSDCKDPYCHGCFLGGPSNSSQCISTNVKIIGYFHYLYGVTRNGEYVYINDKFLRILRGILPPGINIIGITFGMTIMKNYETIKKTPKEPWRCIDVYKIPYRNNLRIIHQKASYPFSKGTMIEIPIEEYIR